MDTKLCSRCKKIKPVSEFYRNLKSKDGLRYECKECQSNYRKIYSQLFKEHIAKVKKAYDQSEAGKKRKAKFMSKYYSTEKGKETIKKNSRNSYYKRKDKVIEHIKNYQANNPLKHQVHIIVMRELRNGILIKGLCEGCGSIKVDAHHDDYSKPLDIRWLCRSHHRLWHKEHGEGLNG